MESIEINGFLTIAHANFEIRKINILIGAQAQGKSVIAKLVYFFKSFFPNIFIPSIEKFETKRDIDKCVGWVSDSVTQHIEAPNVGLRYR